LNRLRGKPRFSTREFRTDTVGLDVVLGLHPPK